MHDGAVIIRARVVLCGRLRAAADTRTRRISKDLGTTAPRRHRDHGELRCADVSIVSEETGANLYGE